MCASLLDYHSLSSAGRGQDLVRIYMYRCFQILAFIAYVPLIVTRRPPRGQEGLGGLLRWYGCTCTTISIWQLLFSNLFIYRYVCIYCEGQVYDNS